MSSAWSWYIIILSAVNIVGAWWLLQHLSRAKAPAEDGDDGTTGHVWDDDLREYNNPLPRWWIGLFYLTVVFSVIYLILYPGLGNFAGVLGWSQDKQYEFQVSQAESKYAKIFDAFLQQDIAVLAKDKQALKTGQRIFINNCSTCHGSDAQGAVSFPNLADAEWLYGDSPEQIKQSITNGRSGVMPAWGSVLGEEGIKNVVAYTQKISGQAYADEQAALGQQQYQMFCIACHGPEGKGNPMLGAPDLTNDIWLYGGDLPALTHSIANGRNGKMPAHAAFLGNGKIHVLTAYIYSLSKDKSQAIE